MKKEQFLEKLKSNTLSQKYNFVEVGGSRDESTIVILEKNSAKVVGKFYYIEPGLIHSVSMDNFSVYELKRVIEEFIRITDEE